MLLAIDTITGRVTTLARADAMAPYLALDASRVYWIDALNIQTEGHLMASAR